MSSTRPLPTAATLLIVVGAALSSLSCSVDQQVLLRLDGSGTAEVHVELEPVFVDYLLALAEVAGSTGANGATGAPPTSVFDVAELQRAIGSRPAVRIEQIDSPRPEALDLTLSFDNIQEAFAAEGGSIPLVSLSGTGRRTLRVHLDIGNYRQLAAIVPALDNPLIASLGPQPGMAVSEDEYYEMMGFVLGTDGPQSIANSTVTVIIDVAGTIISQRGGKIVDGNVVFTIPLIRILVLDQPLDYVVVFE